MAAHQDPNSAKIDSELDLPAQMFRTGASPELVSVAMYKREFGLVQESVWFTDVDGLALFEGDIVLGTTEVARALEDEGRGIAIRGEEFRWPDGLVPFTVEAVLRDLVQSAIDHWEQQTPFRFIPRTDEEDFVSFEHQTGCWSYVGRQGGRQVISLGSGCGLGAAIHEIGHALGLWHEQSRSDRDQFVMVFLENVDPRQRHNFDKHIQDGIDLGTYDVGSIMHYPELAFSINDKPTILTKNGTSIGQRNGLSAGDIEAMRMVYRDLDWRSVAQVRDEPTTTPAAP